VQTDWTSFVDLFFFERASRSGRSKKVPDGISVGGISPILEAFFALGRRV
jgi:hypothetical protein